MPLPEETKTRRCVHDPLKEFMAHYAMAESTVPARATEARTIEERLKARIIDGNAIGLSADLDEAMTQYTPLQIINDVLLDGMKTVGELFGSGQMQLPFVLQSAETMKTAVSYLEPFMDKVQDTRKGTMVLATVKGDVHDIGKNLVDIILTNNGYSVINLGIKVPIESMLNAAESHRADAIGMSGLLVKSTVIMKENLELMEHRGIHTPVVLGGAALTRRYVEQDLRSVYSGALSYANDAFDGLAFMEEITTGSSKKATVVRERVASGQEAKMLDAESSESVRSAVARDVAIPSTPFFGSKVVLNTPIEKVYEYINEVALVRGQWQVRRGTQSEADYRRMLEHEILPALTELKLKAKRERILQPAVVYGYFPCQSEGNDLIIYRPKDLSDEALSSQWPRTDYEQDELLEWQRFRFPRQSADRRLCIADFFAPVGSGRIDVCAFHVVTMGEAASKHTAELFQANRYREYLFLHGLSVECAEALAEYWHKAIREELGIAGKDASEIKKLFAQGYQGSRYSFGYPACPNLEDQRQIFELLKPERIGVSLTEEFQLVPEQSTSAIIVHHPEARYFNVK